MIQIFTLLSQNHGFNHGMLKWRQTVVMLMHCRQLLKSESVILALHSSVELHTKVNKHLPDALNFENYEQTCFDNFRSHYLALRMKAENTDYFLTIQKEVQLLNRRIRSEVFFLNLHSE